LSKSSVNDVLALKAVNDVLAFITYALTEFPTYLTTLGLVNVKGTDFSEKTDGCVIMPIVYTDRGL